MKKVGNLEGLLCHSSLLQKDRWLCPPLSVHPVERLAFYKVAGERLD